MLLFTAITVLALLCSVGATHCKTGLSSSPSGGCYRVVEDSIQLTWDQARQYCQKNYWADLVRFDDKEDEDSVTPRNSTWNYWMGLNDMTQEGDYKWLDDVNTTSYTNWGINQPANHDSLDCVSVGNGKWSEMYCGTALPFICGAMPVNMKGSSVVNTTMDKDMMMFPETNETGSSDVNVNATMNEDMTFSETNETESVQTTSTITVATTTAAQCDEGWVMLGDLGCIKFFRDAKRTWKDARENCRAFGADLVVVPDSSTHKLIRNLFPKSDSEKKDNYRYWFGLKQQTDDSPFRWLDMQDKDPEFARFCGQKDVNTEKPACGLIVGRKLGRWNQGNCNDLHHSMCMENAAIRNLLQVTAPTDFAFPTTTEEIMVSTTTNDTDGME